MKTLKLKRDRKLSELTNPSVYENALALNKKASMMDEDDQGVMGFLESSENY